MDVNTSTMTTNLSPACLGDLDIDEFFHFLDEPASPETLHAVKQGRQYEGDNGGSFSPGVLPEDLGRGDEVPINGNASDGPKPGSLSSNSALPLIDSQDYRQTIEVNASLNGLFFRDEESALTSESSLEIMCYRRNLFKVHATVVLPQEDGHLALGGIQGNENVVGLSAHIRDIENLKADAVTIVKATSKNVSSSSTRATGDELQPLPVSIKLNQHISMISWERLQFRNSAIKTGARQYYRVIVELIGILSDGRTVSLSKSQSPLISVRGRSPRCYTDQRNPKHQTIPMEFVVLGPIALSHSPRITVLGPAIIERVPVQENATHSSPCIPTSRPDLECLMENYTYVPMPIKD